MRTSAAPLIWRLPTQSVSQPQPRIVSGIGGVPGKYLRNCRHFTKAGKNSSWRFFLRFSGMAQYGHPPIYKAAFDVMNRGCEFLPVTWQ